MKNGTLKDRMNGSLKGRFFSKRLFQATKVLKNAKHQIGYKVNITRVLCFKLIVSKDRIFMKNN